MKLEHCYSDNVFNQKMVIIGLNPPPLGGIAIHIARVKAKLLCQNNAISQVDVIKQSRKRSKLGYFAYLFGLIREDKPDIVYYHTLSLRSLPLELALLVILRRLFNYNLILIDHTPRFFYGKNWLYKKSVNFLLRFIDKQVLIGNSTYRAYIENNVYINPSFSIESPYLSPDLEKASEIFEKYPQNLKDFVSRCSPLVLVNGSAVRLLNDVDLYGFDMALDLFKNLKSCFANCGLIIVLAEIGDKSYFDNIYSKIKTDPNIYLLLGCTQEIWPLFKCVDLFIRPTCSDAYGISIQEALEMNVKVIASDVCQRPEGAILFESRNQEALNKIAGNILSNTFFKNNICQ